MQFNKYVNTNWLFIFIQFQDSVELIVQYAKPLISHHW